MSRGWCSLAFVALCTACSGGDTGRGPGAPGGGSGGAGGSGTTAAGTSGGTGDFGNPDSTPTGGTGATGGTGSTVTGGTGGSAGTGSGSFTTGSIDLDPNAEFVWEETVPGQGACQPGRYVGTFTCNYVAMGGNPAMPLAIVTGPVAMTLEQSQSGEFLEITDGTLEGIAQLIFGFRAELQGTLDCATNTLDASALNGVYGFGDPAIFPAGMFEGTLSGTLDRSTVTISGDWQMSVMNNGGNCDGPWDITWTP